MGISTEQNLRSVRISLGRFSTEEDVEQAVLHITGAVAEKQKLAGQPTIGQF
jgi:cysteine sulfinate desulfinase/cysteine desulfurase-like protein